MEYNHAFLRFSALLEIMLIPSLPLLAGEGTPEQAC